MLVEYLLNPFVLANESPEFCMSEEKIDAFAKNVPGFEPVGG
jgi:hypothetical protein